MSLGKDLATIRKSQNLSLEDIQNAVKIPLDTVKSIESGEIFEDPNMNKTYVRSFVRSYAKVLKLDDEDVVKALDDMEVGIYSGDLLAGTESPEEYSGTPDFQKKDLDEDENDVEQTTDSKAAAFRADKPTPAPAPSKEPAKPPKASSDPEVSTVNWADMGRKFTTAGKSSKVWMVISFLIVLGLIAGSAYIFWDDIASIFEDPAATQQETMDPPSNQETILPTPVDTSAVSEQDPVSDPDVQEPVSNEPITLGDTLTVSLYAAYGQLEPVRVTSDFNWRTNPFWMEEGEAYNFDFRDTLLVRGQYSRMLLLFNGHIIENPRQSYFDTSFNSIMITRSILDQPGFLAPAPQDFPLEVGAPDSTVYRINY